MLTKMFQVRTEMISFFRALVATSKYFSQNLYPCLGQIIWIPDAPSFLLVPSARYPGPTAVLSLWDNHTGVSEYTQLR